MDLLQDERIGEDARKKERILIKKAPLNVKGISISPLIAE